MKPKIKIRFIVIFSTCFIFSVYSQGWKKLETTGSITPRSNASAIYIPSQHTLFVFGGVTDTGNTNELWSLDLNSKIWTQISSPSVDLPDPRFTHVCMFDSVQNRILVWSGQGDVLYNDIWAFHLNDSTWENLFKDGNVNGAPLKRYGTATVFDPEKRNIINFAGFTTSGRFDDTWSFQVDNKTWTDKTNSFFPIKRCLTTACIAPERREMIVFGGQSSGNLNDIWKLNTDTFSWTDLSPAINPTARHFASSVYCGKGNVVIFGGDTLNQGNKAGAVNDLWAFSLDNGQWKELSQSGAVPLPRYGHTATYIKEKDQLVVFGGQGTTALFSDTWIYEHLTETINSIRKDNPLLASFYCFPNPSVTHTQFNFSLTETSTVTLRITDINGQLMTTLLNEALPEGEHAVPFPHQLAPGVYLCTLITKSAASTIPVIVIQ